MKIEKLQFNLELYSEYWDIPPRIELSVDNNVIFNGKIKADKQNPHIISFSKIIEQDKEHILTIKRMDKSTDQCILENGKIIKDQILYIKKIEIDDIDIGTLVYEGVFYPEYDKKWAEEQQKNNVQLPESIKQINSLGHNGTWKLTFNSPFYMWLLENLY
jgi:hypothetical protein